MSAPKPPPAETSSHGQKISTALSPVPTRPGDDRLDDRFVDRFVAHLATAGELVAAGRVREAEVEVLRALSGMPADLRALNLLALVRFKLGRLDEARATYREVVELAPSDASARRHLGLLALKLERIDEAIPELEMAARLAPGDNQAWSYLGYAYAKKGETVQAAAAFRRAGQDALADELDHAAISRRPSSGPKLGALTSGTGTPPPAAAPAGLAARGGTAAGALVLPPPSAEARPSSRVSPGAAVAEARPSSRVSPGAAVAEARPSSRVSPGAAVASLPSPFVGAAAESVHVERESAATKRNGSARPEGAAPRAAPPEPLEPSAPVELTPVPLLGFVLARLGLGETPRAPFGEALRLGVDDEAYVRAGVALAAVGVRFEPAFRRMQGRRSAEPLAGDGAPFFRLVGPGEVWVAGAPGAWQAVSLEDDILYVREDRVLAFDGGVSWEAGAVPGDGLRMLQFRGRGCVVLRLDAPPIAVKVTEDRPALVARANLLGWVGRLVPHRQRAAGASPFELACQGEGVVLFDGDPGRVPVPPGARSGGQSPPALGSAGGAT